VLRSSTQGKAQFTMEFSTYKQAPTQVSEDIKKEFAKTNEK
jgi:elongation factor G